MIDVVVAASYPAFRLGLAATLTSAGETMRVVGQASTGEQILAVLAARMPTVVVIDCETSSGDLADAVWAIVAESTLQHPPSVAVIVLLPLTDVVWAGTITRAGVRGLLPRHATPAELIAAVQAAAAGLLAIFPPFLDALTHEEATPSEGDAAPAHSLSPRETQVLQYVAQGLPNKAIAQRLGVSEHTVKFHMSALMAKLGAASRAEAVATAARLGMIVL